jgi:hypothetical protein
MQPRPFNHMHNSLTSTVSNVPIRISHCVDLEWQAITKEEGMEKIHDALKILLPYLGDWSIVAPIVEVSLDENIGDPREKGTVHGRTSIFYSKKRSAVVATIQLNRNTNLNTDALISTLLHEMAHLLHATTIHTCLTKSVTGCGGHDDKFYAINTMLVTLFKTDVQGRAMLIAPDSDVFDVSRFVEFSMLPVADEEIKWLSRILDHAADSFERTERSKKPSKIKVVSNQSRSKSSKYHIY